MSTHSASTTMDDIIDELQLKYDPSSGLLDGDAIREIPSLNTLLNLNKLLSKLSRNLDSGEAADESLIRKIDGLLAKEDADDTDEEKATKIKTEAGKKRVRSVAEEKENEEEEEDDSMGEDTEPLAKKRRQAVETTSEAPQVENADAQEEAVDVHSLQNGDPPINSKNDPVPPVQLGSFTPSNDTRLKNPKSEFVGSQTLSAEAIAELGLFSEDHNGLETQGKDYLKKYYGVASYPERDLKDMLPGEIPDVDFSKTKAPANQVQLTTYASYVESFFRPFLADDIAFCKEKFIIPPGFEKDYEPSLSPYLIPKLGIHYSDVWGEEDAALKSKLSSPSAQRPPLEAYKAKGKFDEVNDENLLTEDVSCGPLSSRLLSAVLSVHEVKSRNDDDEDGGDIKQEGLLDDNLFSDDVATLLDIGDGQKALAEANDYYSIEERLKRELKFIGIFMSLPHTEDKPKTGSIVDNEEWVLNKEDDEVSLEMRALQKELRGVTVRNHNRKKLLVPILEEQLAFQEYCTILEDLDKQVDTAYVKRLKAKSKKKRTPELGSNAQQQAANSGLRALLDKRSRWIDNIGKLFPAPEVMKRIPSESVFQTDVHAEEEETEDVMIEEPQQ